MNNTKGDSRKQRFENLEKAYHAFCRILEIETPNEAERMGLIQAFKVVFELSWKTLKDYLLILGFDEKSPRNALKQAFQMELVSDGHMWMEALESRNDTVHTYDDKMAEEMINKIRDRYAVIIKEVYIDLKNAYDNE